MPNAFIFHGTGGHSEENWFPWMKKELIKLGYDVIIPNFPEPDNPTPDNWYPVIDELKEKVDSDSIVIGHSLGGAIALRFLERIKTPVKITAIVSATLGIPPIKYIEGDSPFLEGGFDWDRIKSHSKNFLVFHSDNDPYVCIANGQKAADELGVKLSVIPNAGHINEAAGYTQFSELLTTITNLL